MIELKQQLLDLSALDRSFQIFGSSKHQYQSGSIKPERINQFQHALGIQLPSEYREFLVQFGLGAGP